MVARTGKLCLLHLVAAGIPFLHNLLLLQQQTLGHLVHIVRVYLREMGRGAVLESVDGGSRKAVLQVLQSCGPGLAEKYSSVR